MSLYLDKISPATKAPVLGQIGGLVRFFDKAINAGGKTQIYLLQTTLKSLGYAQVAGNVNLGAVANTAATVVAGPAGAVVAGAVNGTTAIYHELFRSNGGAALTNFSASHTGICVEQWRGNTFLGGAIIEMGRWPYGQLSYMLGHLDNNQMGGNLDMGCVYYNDREAYQAALKNNWNLSREYLGVAKNNWGIHRTRQEANRIANAITNRRRAYDIRCFNCQTTAKEVATGIADAPKYVAVRMNLVLSGL